MDESKIIEAFDKEKDEVWTDDDQFTMGYNNGLEMGKNIALELLKEQEAVEPVPDYNIRYWRCPKCNWLLASMIDDKCDIPVRRDNYCARCGQAVKWK